MTAPSIPLSEPSNDSPSVANNVAPPPPDEFTPAADDCRMYHPDAEGWFAHIQRETERQYCYAKAPGQDYFHLIIPGEIFIQKGDEKLCLMCAVRMGVLTANRLFWQSPKRKGEKRPKV